MQLAAAPGILIHSDIYQAVDGLRGERPQAGGYALYFGDIHTHSGQIGDQEDVSKGCGMGSREENYAYAKGPGGLDFYALTDHEYQFEGDAGAYFGLAEAWDDPGRFACLPGYEHTSLCYGHRNVYFRGPGGAVVSATASGGGPTRDLSDATPPGELWRQLEANGVPFMTVPHHPSSASHPCSWDFYDPRYDRLVEVYSTWGSSEYYGDFPKGVTDRYRGLDVREALGRGMRMGLIASADGHDGHPGNAQSPFAKHHHQFHPLGSGRAVVLAEELTRKAVFDALYARRCYATTGPPIVLDFRVNGALMGCELPSSQRPPIVQLRAEGTNGLDHVRIVKDGRVVHTAACHGRRSFELEWSDDAYRPYVPAFYYVRVVQVDGESAWSSPVWLG
jgi:hypothetical protein